MSFSSPAPSLSLAEKFPWVLTDAVLNVRQLLAKLGFVSPKPVLHWHLLLAPPEVHLPCQTLDLSSPGSLLQWKCSVQRFIHYSKACSKRIRSVATCPLGQGKQEGHCQFSLNTMHR